jgi:plasmid stabilization system protein ParE
MIRYLAGALREIDEILDYIAVDNPQASKRLGDAIQRTISWIDKWPLLSPIVHNGSLRSKLVSGYQYRVYYVVEGPDVIIHNVRSTRRLRPWEDQSR